jgi:hypothetical protein
MPATILEAVEAKTRASILKSLQSSNKYALGGEIGGAEGTIMAFEPF